MPEAVIVGAVRTPIGKRAGSLKDWRPDDLAAFVLRALADRTGIEPRIVEDVVLGCVTQVDEQGLNIDLGDAPEEDRKSTSELQSPCNLVCRLLLEKKKTSKH